jgi:hypothetical protein
LYQGVGFAGPFGKELVLSDLHYEGTNITRYGLGQYKIKAGPSKKSVDSFKDLQEFMKFINDSTTEITSESAWEKRLDILAYFARKSSPFYFMCVDIIMLLFFHRMVTENLRVFLMVI